MFNTRTITRFLFGLGCLTAGSCVAGPPPAATATEVVLNDLAGTARRPLDTGGHLASVLIFFWHDCPVSNGCAPELNRVAAAHTNFAFYIVQVDPGLTAAAAREHARTFELRAPVLLDPQHRLVQAVHATVTPEAVVVAKDGRILYRGRIDDSYASLGKKRATVTKHDLLDALDAIAAGRPVEAPETKPVGCLIQ